jgi:hypothetical protein
MSYARFAKDESHVYVFLSVDGALECCGCRLEREGRSVSVQNTQQMLNHLALHKTAGHLVPDYCTEGLIEDRDENDAWIATGRTSGSKET